MKEPRRALLIAEKTSRPSYEPRHGEAPTGRHFVRKPDRNNGRQALRERPEPGPRNATRRSRSRSLNQISASALVDGSSSSTQNDRSGAIALARAAAPPACPRRP